MRKRFLSLALALGLVASLAMSAISVSAQEGPGFDEVVVHYDGIYFPWVPNNDTIDGVVGNYGSITVQNVVPQGELAPPERGVRIFVFTDDWIWSVANDPEVTFEDALVGLPDDAQLFDEGEKVPTFVLAPNASQTITPAQLGIEEPGSGVTVFGVYRAAWEDAIDGAPFCDGPVRDITFIDDSEDPPVCNYIAPVIAGVQKQAASADLHGSARTSDDHITVDGYTAIPFTDVSWGSQSNTCFDLVGGLVDFCDGSGYYLSPGGFLASPFIFDGHSYLPIAQTNDGWNTIINLTNVDFTNTTAASVDVTLITTDQQGYGASGSSKWSDTLGIAPGDTYHLDVSDVVSEDEWVGSVHITSEVGVVATAQRVKPSTNMAMINTSAPSLWSNLLGDFFDLIEEEFGDVIVPDDAENQLVGPGGKFEQYAPLIFQDYEGWNTGISFVNNAEATNTVTVTYYGPTGNVVGGDQLTISPLGQEFVYTPAQQDIGFGSGFVGSAVFSSDLPFHIAVDQVKYSTGEAMSYIGTAAGAGWFFDFDFEWPEPIPFLDRFIGDELAIPLVQKGTQDGSGDISGLQIFNADAHDPSSAAITFYDGSGAAVGPTKDTPYPITLGPVQNATLYTLTLSEMSQNQRSSAVIVPTGNFDDDYGQIVGVSNNVNYDVQGDGSAAYNMVNRHGQYRFPHPNMLINLIHGFLGGEFGRMAE